MALSWLRCVERQLLADDVLYHGRWMDDQYFLSTASGKFNGLSTQQVEEAFNQSVCGNPVTMVGFMALVVVLGFFICSFGLQRGWSVLPST